MDERKYEIAKVMMNAEVHPVKIEKDVPLETYTKLPLSNISTLGVAFEPLMAAAQHVFGDAAGTQSGLYRVTIPNGRRLATFNDGSGYLGSVLTESGGVGGGQARLNPLVCDPTMLFMAAALANINKKLDSIQEIQQELLDFLAQKERSELKGDLNFLTDVMNNYKFNWNNDKYKNSNHIKVLDIMQSAERKIDFYKERISSMLNKRSLFHSDQEVKRQLEKMQSEFKDYQISLYLYAFSSFLQVMLLENFNAAYLDGIAHKIEDYSFEYRDLYTKSFAKIEKYANSSIQSSLLKGLATANKIAGEAIAKVPVISKSQIDETLIEAGEKVENFGSKRAAKTIGQFIEKQSAYVRPFIDNINVINKLYNQPLELLLDGDNLYLGTG